MAGIDWRELYAANQATIRAGLPANLASGLAPYTAMPAALGTDPPGAASLRAHRQDERRASVHVPSGMPRAIPVPLVCLLHGCTQDPATFAAATLMNAFADRYGFVVVYPGQDRDSNPQRCWNWFLPEHQRRGAGEPAAIATIIGDLIESDARFTVDHERVFVVGLSSGGAMAAILSACYPELFAAVAIHSGLPYRSAKDLPSALQAMAGRDRSGEGHRDVTHAAMEHRSRPIPSIVIHGKADRTVAPVNAIRVLRQSMTANHLAAPHHCNHDPARPTNSWRARTTAGYTYTHSRWTDERGNLMHELLEVDELGHAWSGGAVGGSYSDPRGPSATEAICTFFSLTTRNVRPH